VAALYERIDAPLIVTDPATAETIKYACNAFLATKVSFINAVANLCQAVSADVRDVILGMGYDRRIGFEFLKPGPGWGGSCFPKDSRALVRIAEDHGYRFDLLEGVITVNDQQFDLVASRVERLAGGDLNGARVAIWGLTFKADTDDLRDSPALQVIQRLQRRGALIRAYDPTVDSQVSHLPGDLAIEICQDAYAACADARVLAVLTEWDEFRWVDFAKVSDGMASPAILDARNLLDPGPLRRRGFRYEGMGRN
jgi:UDPglucose 6-dehydrogenase